ncbi:DeoR/GlpR family DNA-binding transcription regulator [Flavobacterium sp. LS1R47]|uniref:DeoR/GlpR family DNA-binding transcription regulator n=1 Tax=Flavobacterium frigoritolerans TaxID=2987686 RepID=A0A9X3HNH9_9FLAO|nr:DeoR/GlpR family DNA-binding transcription regulator [Flavobacterium frigoritolerans]MCV9934118.1 DeoR/GlpR family DNA-binding transcription regulator [Flavobacterium frigoritolerans]
MLKEERFEKILSSLAAKGKVSYESLSLTLKVSEDTVRRDIEALHKNGLLSKVRGGAILVEKNPLSFVDRASYLTDKKEIIALKAQQFINDGQTLFMDGGTTNCSIATKIPITANLTIITNNISIVPILANHKNINLILLGGSYNPQTQTTEGAKTCEEIKNYIVDNYFLGTCAVDSKFGVTATYKNDGDVKNAMYRSSKNVIALALLEKLDLAESYKVCPMDEVGILITELASNDPKLDAYRNTTTKLV